MNNWNGIGRLTKDVDLKYTPQGKAVANFTIAINRPFKNSNNEQEADFILVQAWGKLAENLANFTRKGSQVGVTGRIQTRNYEGNDGKRVYVTEIIADSVQFLDPKQGNGQGQQGNNQGNQQWGGQSQQQYNGGGQPQYQQQPQQQYNNGGQPQYQQQYSGGQPQHQQSQQQFNGGGQQQWNGQPQQQFNGGGQPQQQWGGQQQQSNQQWGNGGNGPIEVSEADLPF